MYVVSTVFLNNQTLVYFYLNLWTVRFVRAKWVNRFGFIF